MPINRSTPNPASNPFLDQASSSASQPVQQQSKKGNEKNPTPPANTIPEHAPPSYELLFSHDEIPRALFAVGQEYGGPALLNKANPQSDSKLDATAKVYKDLHRVVNSWDKLTVFVDNSGSMGFKGSLVYYPGLGELAHNPRRCDEGHEVMGHVLKFIQAARDPARPLPIEFIPINKDGWNENTDPNTMTIKNIATHADLSVFMREFAPNGGTPMRSCIQAYIQRELGTKGKSLDEHRKFMILGDGDDNRASGSQLASTVLQLKDKFNGTISLFPLVGSEGNGLKWMNRADAATKPGQVDTNDDFISEYFEKIEVTVKNQYNRLDPKRASALKEIKALSRQFQTLEKSFIGSGNDQREVSHIIESMQAIEMKYELKLHKSDSCYTAFDHIVKPILAELREYDLADERNSKTQMAVNMLNRGINSMRV